MPEPSGHSIRTLASPVLLRRGGFLLAVPKDFIPEADLQLLGEVSPEALIGPSTTLEVRAAEEDEPGIEAPLDVTIGFTRRRRPETLWNPLTVTEPEDLCPFHSDPDISHMVPHAPSLLEAARAWLELQATDCAGFFSAQEQAVPAKAKQPKAKRVAAAQPAVQVTALTDLLPKLTQQVQGLPETQVAFGTSPTTSSECRPSMRSPRCSM